MPSKPVANTSSSAGSPPSKKTVSRNIFLITVIALIVAAVGIAAAMDTMGSQNTTLNANYTTLSSLYSNLQTNYSNLNSQYASLESQYNSLSSEYAKLNSTYNTINEAYSQLLGGYQVQGSLSIDAANITSDNTMTVYLRNSGAQTETVNNAYVDNIPVNMSNVLGGEAYVATIPVGGTATLYLQGTAGSGWGNGSAFQVRMVAASGDSAVYAASAPAETAQSPLSITSVYAYQDPSNVGQATGLTLTVELSGAESVDFTQGVISVSLTTPSGSNSNVYTTSNFITETDFANSTFQSSLQTFQNYAPSCTVIELQGNGNQLLEQNEQFAVFLNLNSTYLDCPLPPNAQFTVELIPADGAGVTYSGTIPAMLNPVMQLAEP